MERGGGKRCVYGGEGGRRRRVVPVLKKRGKVLMQGAWGWAGLSHPYFKRKGQAAHQMRELLEREVGCERRLPSLPALDPDAHMRRLNHSHIVASVPDRRGTRPRHGLSDEPHDLGLLGRGAPAAEDGGGGVGHFHEEALVVGHAEGEGGAVEHEAGGVELALCVWKGEGA